LRGYFYKVGKSSKHVILRSVFCDVRICILLVRS